MKDQLKRDLELLKKDFKNVYLTISTTSGIEKSYLSPIRLFKNSAIFHNGHLLVKNQTAKLILTNYKNKDKIFTFKITNLNPYQTFKFELD